MNESIVAQSPNRVTVVGTGNMGSAVARGLVGAGYHVTVWNRSPAKAAELATSGAMIAETVPDALRASDHIVVLLIDAASVRDVLLGEVVSRELQGKAIALSTATTIDECHSLEIDLKAAGARLSDIQITTFPAKVEERDSEFVMACHPADKADWWQIFTSLGSKLHDAGAVGNAGKMQLGIAMSSAFLMLAIAHSVAACEKMGLPTDVIRTLLAQNPDIRIPQAAVAIPEMNERRYGDGPWTVTNMIALLDWLVAEAGRLELEPSALVAVLNLYRQAQTHGFGEQNITAVYEIVNPSTRR